MEYFELILHTLKTSVWWNIHGFVLIKNVQTINSCDSSHFYLKMIWQFSISNAMFLCHDSNVGISLHTFNPYSTVPPDFSQNLEVYYQENGNAFSLLKSINQTMSKYLKRLLLILCRPENVLIKCTKRVVDSTKFSH